MRQAADQGFVRAQFNLGLSYDGGIGVAREAAEAARWFTRAAVQGDPGAQQSLGVMYANGDGVPQDLVLAHTWLSLAAAGTTGDARSSALQGLQVIEARLSPAERAEADARREAFLPTPER